MKNRLALLLSLICFTFPVLGSCSAQPDETEDNLRWWQNTIVYEAYPSSFQDTDGDGYGDINGLISRLDYLESLGVGAIWLTPIYASPMKDNGYDVADYYSINPLYGTMEDMEKLISEADKRNIKIVMDLVFNHTSDENEWFRESASGKDNKKSDWYIWRDPGKNGKEPNNWRGIFGGSAWTWCEQRQQYYLHTFGSFQPDLNWENPEVRNALYDIANFWIDKGVGGFRIDAITYIKKPSDFSSRESSESDGMVGIHEKTANTEGILDFLNEFKTNVLKGHDIFTVGEANGVPVSELKYWVGDEGVFDMIFLFDAMNLWFSKGESWASEREWKLTELKKILSDHQAATAKEGWYPICFENHDQPRSITHFLKEDADPVLGAQCLGMVLMTLRGTPFVYEGEELGCTNAKRNTIEEYDDVSSHNQYKTMIRDGLSEEEALRYVQRHSRDNARTPMQWDTTRNAGFTTGTPWLALNKNYPLINAETEDADPESVLNWYRKLARLRTEYPVLADGDYSELLPDSEEIYAYSRTNNNSKAVIMVNFNSEKTEYPSELTEDTSLAISNYENTEKGILQPFEAVCYIK